jgi:hypothetical protein
MRQSLFTVAALVMAVPAAAQADSEAITKFGLEGHWAISCAAPPAPTNPHVRVATSMATSPTRELMTGTPATDNVLELINARPVGDDQLTFEEIMDGKRVTFLVVMQEGRYRVTEMVTEDGKALVTHAVQNWDGKDSPWYQRCR